MAKLVRMVLGGAMASLLVACQQVSTVPDPGATRPIAHAMGTTQVPMAPQRVVVLDTAALDAALAVDILPVGTAIYGQFPAYLKGAVGEAGDEIAIVGNGNQPNLEAVLTLQPDLILGSKIGVGELYPQLSQIAPTVLTEGSGRAGEWQDNFQLYAEALGRSAQAEQRLQAYQQRVEQLQERLGQPQNLEISILAITVNSIGAYTAGSFPGSVLRDIGLSRPEAQSTMLDYALQLSREATTALDGDYIFLIYSAFLPDAISKNDFMAEPIWSQLKAVQQNQVCEVDGAVWAAGRNILAADQILQDVEACLQLAQ